MSPPTRESQNLNLGQIRFANTRSESWTFSINLFFYRSSRQDLKLAMLINTFVIYDLTIHFFLNVSKSKGQFFLLQSKNSIQGHCLPKSNLPILATLYWLMGSTMFCDLHIRSYETKEERGGWVLQSGCHCLEGPKRIPLNSRVN